MILKMAFRNILRHKRRTLLTSLMMLGGYVLISFSLALVDGTYSDMIELFTSQSTGHAQIHHQKYIENQSIYDAIKTYPSLKKKLENHPRVRAFSPRIKGGALAFNKDKTFGVEIRGINWENESKVTTIEKRLAHGRWPTTIKHNHVLLGGKVAETLELKLNDELVLISQAADGSVANDIFHVSGIFKKEGQGPDDYSIYMDILSAKEFYSTQFIHEIAIELNHIDNAREFSNLFELDSKLSIRPWQEVEEDFFRAMQVDKKGNAVSYTIIMIVVALGILNTVLMSILERTREFGVLKAIGTSPLRLGLMIVLEAQMISFFSIGVGSILAFFINSYFSKFGIHFSEPMSYGGMLITGMFAKISPSSFYHPALIVIFTTLIVSFYPAIKSAFISPIDALREN
jgi:putative ABC transport system permease protein